VRTDGAYFSNAKELLELVLKKTENTPASMGDLKVKIQGNWT
jgi:hypothetical protein